MISVLSSQADVKYTLSMTTLKKVSHLTAEASLQRNGDVKIHFHTVSIYSTPVWNYNKL